MSQIEYVTEQVNLSRDFFRGKRNYNRRMTTLFIGTASVLSAVATVSLGATKMVGIQWLEVIALVASGLATVIGAIEALFSHRKLWHINNVAMGGLDKLNRDIEFRKANGKAIDEQEAGGFYARLSEILEEADNSWVSTYSVK